MPRSTMTLCLYSVLSHLPVDTPAKVAAEIARVTRGHFITTVRSIGSPPTIFVNSIEKARHFSLDHNLDRCEVELRSGRRIAYCPFTCFPPASCGIASLPISTSKTLCGLDIFHNQFIPDRRWNPASLQVDQQLSGHLAQLEKTYARNPHFMERATHLLLVGCRASRPAWILVQLLGANSVEFVNLRARILWILYAGPRYMPVWRSRSQPTRSRTQAFRDIQDRGGPHGRSRRYCSTRRCPGGGRDARALRFSAA